MSLAILLVVYVAASALHSSASKINVEYKAEAEAQRVENRDSVINYTYNQCVKRNLYKVQSRMTTLSAMKKQCLDNAVLAYDNPSALLHKN